MLVENEIRPDDLMRGQKEAFARDVERLLSRRSEFVEVPCPACGSGDHSHRLVKHSLDYVTCDACDTMFITPRPSPAVLDWFYAGSENYAYWNDHIFPASENARREKIFRPRAERLREICARHGVPQGAMLEVGAGFGTFGEEVVRLGLFERYIAVEPTPRLAQTCRDRGLETIEKPIEHIDLTGTRVSCVAAFEVIEHLFDPAAFLGHMFEALSPGGLVVLSCPNGKGFEIDVLQGASNSVDPEHLNYFHPKSFAHLAERVGFEVLEVLTPGELDAELVRKAVLDGGYDLSGQGFLKTILIDRWDELARPFQDFLKTNALSSHMWLVGRRP